MVIMPSLPIGVPPNRVSPGLVDNSTHTLAILGRFRTTNNPTAQMGVCFEVHSGANPHFYFFWGDLIDFDPDVIVMKPISTPAMLKAVKKQVSRVSKSEPPVKLSTHPQSDPSKGECASCTCDSIPNSPPLHLPPNRTTPKHHYITTNISCGPRASGSFTVMKPPIRVWVVT